MTDIAHPLVSRATPKVQLLAWTHFDAGAANQSMAGFQTDVGGGEALAEAAGRACYQSFEKPNPATATNAGYLRHILEVGHGSVLEHGTASFYLTGVSRSLTHELVRHRHLSYSQQSQRYVNESNAGMVLPDLLAEDPESTRIFDEAVAAAQLAYDKLVSRTTARLQEAALAAQGAAPNRTELRKAARQAARAVLPNATETAIVVTGNYRAWRHFISMRATKHADVEIRKVAIMVLRELQRVTPNVFGDYRIAALADGTEVAVSPYAQVSG